MHIPDGYLGPKTFYTCYLLVAPFWWWAWRSLRQRMQTMEIPHIALAAAFVFVIMMFNVPGPGGTSGHAVGAGVVAIALGAWPAVLAVSFALIIQALMFGDGGVTAIGANCLNMAVIQVFVSLWIWKLARPRDLRNSSARTFIAAFAAGYIGLVVASFTTAVQFGLQPVLERGPDGTPQFSPFPLRIAVPVMVLSHLLLSIIEGAITGFLVLALARSRETVMTESANLMPAPAMYRRKSFWATVAVVLLAVPLGIFIPNAFKAGDAWGEWAPEEAAERASLSEVPAGMKKFSEIWNAPIPDYAFKEAGSSAGESLQYIGSAVLGVIIITLLFVALGKWQKARMREQSERST